MPGAPVVPNHHADHPGFRGFAGLLAGLSFVIGGGAHARLATELTAVGAGDAVVDIGCGSGTAVRRARRRGATATGVDPAPVMLRLAARLSPAEGITWARGAAEQLPVPDASATVAWSLAAVHHWRDVAAGLAEVVRVLRSGGRFLAAERRIRPGARGLRSHGWTGEQAEVFADACRTAGLTEVAVSTHRPRRALTMVVTARAAS
jgi:ubiquinone/menaquinone biosynthesis C-methylase UbiE